LAEPWTGLVAFGFPVIAALLGLAATGNRFGVVAALVDAGLPAAAVVLPASMWVTDMVRPVRPARRRLLWCAVLATILLGLARTPAGFSAGPCLLIVTSETARTVAAAGRARRRAPAPRGRRPRPSLPLLRKGRRPALHPSQDHQ
jgi:hypothetical protein